MPKFITVILMLSLASNSCFADEAEDQANSFASIYASLCLKNLTNLGALREQLKQVPALPQEKAEHFLAGNIGDAWPVPDKNGVFVLALPRDKPICLVYGRRANSEVARKLFTDLVTNAPSPLTTKQVLNEKAQTTANGETQTVSYEWSVPNAPKNLLFTLTTAASETADIQVLGSAAIVSP